MGRLKLIIIIAGGFLAFMGFEEYKVSEGTTGEAAALDVAALESGAVEVSNPHVMLGDHVASYWDCIYQYQQSKASTGEPGPDARVNHVYYPVISVNNPYLAEVAAFQKKYENSDTQPADSEIPTIKQVAILAKTTEFKTIGDIPDGLADMTGLEGLIVNKIESLDSDEINLLRQGFPGFDPEKVLLLEVGRKPSSKVKSLGFMAGGGLLSLLGLGWLVTGFRKP